MHRGVLGCGQHDAGRLLGLGLGQEAVDLVVVGQVAPVAEQQEAKAPTTAVQGHEGRFALAASPHDRRNDHPGGQDSLGQLRHAVIGGLLEPQVFRREAKVAETNLDGGHWGRRGNRSGLGVGHGDQAPAPGRGTSCPWAHPDPSLPLPFIRPRP